MDTSKARVGVDNIGRVSKGVPRGTGSVKQARVGNVTAGLWRLLDELERETERERSKVSTGKREGRSKGLAQGK